MYRCYYCPVTIPASFYQHMVEVAGHPPICQCRYSFSGSNPVPWSVWVKVPTQTGTTTDEAIDAKSSH